MKTKKLILIVFALVALGLAAFAGFVVLTLSAGKQQNFESDHIIYVYPGMTGQEVVDSLVDAGIVKNRKSLERSFLKEGAFKGIKPGRYVVESTSTNAYVARMLVFGWQTPQRFTLSGTIRTKERLYKLISSQMMVDYKTVADSLSDPAFLARYGTNERDLFAFFLPDTYEMYWTATIGEIMARMKKESDIWWTADRIRKAKAQGLTPLEASILASIVSGETNQQAEYPKIAGVYLNRLHIGMLLQADPTVAFCFDYVPKRILNSHLQVNSPYNTYKYAGLPPGPICVPSKACIDGVLNPQGKDYLYFCASAAFDGTHKFAADYKDHLANAREFQQALNARGL